MNIIGRKAEQQKLKRCCSSTTSELVCVYGRRRVGKTYLVEQFFSGDFAFHATGVYNVSTRDQLKAFGECLFEYGDSSRTAPKNWFEAFSRLMNILSLETVKRSRGRRVVFLDEFPWFTTSRSVFMRAFANFWNKYSVRNPDILVVICGSSTSWIIENVIENSGDLFDRITEQIFLEPFTLAETEAFFNCRNFEWNRRKVAECQMIFGGLPFFFDRLDANESIAQNVDRLCLSNSALFKNESMRLLETTLRKSSAYELILDELSKHREGMLQSALENKLDISHPTFIKALGKLVECRYVEQSFVPHKEGRHHFVQIIDPFLLFHYTFIAPSNSGNRYKHWQDFIEEEGKYVNWRGHAFEILCQYHVESLKRAINIADVKTKNYPWSSKQKKGGAQIDLVFERADELINICEMKFTDEPFSIDSEYEQKILNKKKVFKRESKLDWPVKIVMVTAGGFEYNQYSDSISTVVTLDDLFDNSQM